MLLGAAGSAGSAGFAAAAAARRVVVGVSVKAGVVLWLSGGPTNSAAEWLCLSSVVVTLNGLVVTTCPPPSATAAVQPSSMPGRLHSAVPAVLPSTANVHRACVLSMPVVG